MKINITVEEQLRRLKTQTGIRPNISARIAFFRSIESGYTFDPKLKYELNSKLELDKVTWLGKTQLVTELLLKKKYPTLDGKELQVAWASHVEHGIGALRSHKYLTEILTEL
nr:DNA sulfur modification protein DndE [Psychrosphaera haliotis]